MKPWMICSGLLGFVAVGVLLASQVPASPNEQPMDRPGPVTFRGEIVDLWSYIDSGTVGTTDPQASDIAVEAGNPIGLVDDKGIAYLLVGRGMLNPDRDLLRANMQSIVIVKGTLSMRGGLQAIYFESVEPATAAAPATPP